MNFDSFRMQLFLNYNFICSEIRQICFYYWFNPTALQIVKINPTPFIDDHIKFVSISFTDEIYAYAYRKLGSCAVA